jgi:DNA-binding GntR family transcriptional regulator
MEAALQRRTAEAQDLLEQHIRKTSAAVLRNLEELRNFEDLTEI